MPQSPVSHPAVLMLLSSDFVTSRFHALRKAAPDLDVVTRLDECDPARVESIFAFKLPPGVASKLPNLKLVASVGAGVDGLLSAGDIAPHVAITKVVEPGLNLSMAQYIVYELVRHFRSFGRYEAQQLRREWKRQPILDSREHTVAIMGVGAIGKAVAQAVAALGFRVIGWNQSGGTAPGIERIFRGEGELATFVGQADTLVCLLPFTAQTRGRIDAKLLSTAKRGLLLMNVARGGIVVEADLPSLLETGQLSAAVLDVFETEPLPPEHPFWSHPGITVTPHVAAQPSVEAGVEQFIENLRRLQSGEPLLHSIDRSVGY